MTSNTDSSLDADTNSGTATVRTRPCVLVVEDNPDMREFLRRVLDKRGYDFLGAEDGIEGMDLALRERPDLILMDLSLPALDGYEATRLLKAHPDFASVPILAVTAHAREVDHAHALEVGCDGYLSKPYSIRQLFDLIAQHLPLDK